MSAPSGGNGGNGGNGGTATPNPTVGSVHVQRPLGAIPAKPSPKPVKKAPKRKR